MKARIYYTKEPCSSDWIDIELPKDCIDIQSIMELKGEVLEKKMKDEERSCSNCACKYLCDDYRLDYVCKEWVSNDRLV